MCDRIEEIKELPAAKRRKRWAEAHAHLELPIPSAVSWLPTSICAMKIIHEGVNRVAETSLENTRTIREDHESESKRLHLKRFHKKTEAKTLDNRNIDKIKPS